MTVSLIFFFNLRRFKTNSIRDNDYYRVFNYINVPMEVKKKRKRKKTKTKTRFLYLFSTIAVLKHMSLKENKVQFRKNKTPTCLFHCCPFILMKIDLKLNRLVFFCCFFLFNPESKHTHYNKTTVFLMESDFTRC